MAVDEEERRIIPRTSAELWKLLSVTESLGLQQLCLCSPGSKCDLRRRKHLSISV